MKFHSFFSVILEKDEIRLFKYNHKDSEFILNFC